MEYDKMKGGCSPSVFARREFLSLTLSGLAASAFASKSAVLNTPQSSADEDWANVRAQFMLKPGVIFMNNASLGMPPAVVAQAVVRGYEAISRDPIAAKHELSDLIQQSVRPSLARFLGANTNEIVLTRNASEALHLAIMGLQLKPGEEVLLTNQEHPAMRQPWQYRARHHDIVVTEVAMPSPLHSAEDVVQRFAERISRRTRVLAFCHVTRGGHLYPVCALAALARERGLVSLVDGAQALGMLPVNVREFGCDLYAASLHKWMLGPIGTGLLYVREEIREQVKSVYHADSTREQPNYDPIGTADLPLKAALATAVDFIEKIGINTIAARNRFLSDHLKAQLRAWPAAKILSGATSELSAPGSTIFEIGSTDAEAVVQRLAAHQNIHIDEHKRNGHNALRVSTHFYNTTQELDLVLEALRG